MIESDERVMAAIAAAAHAPTVSGGGAGRGKARPCAETREADARLEDRLLAGVPGPPPRVWRRIESALRDEGLIRG